MDVEEKKMKSAVAILGQCSVLLPRLGDDVPACPSSCGAADLSTPVNSRFDPSSTLMSSTTRSARRDASRARGR